MSDEKTAYDWNLADWERALTIHVGTAYACRACGNLVMVTRGGIGTLELSCCGAPMTPVNRPTSERRAQ